jgi:hypothetical protein
MTEQAAFEDFYTQTLQGNTKNLRQGGDGKYLDIMVATLWRAWQARAAQDGTNYLETLMSRDGKSDMHFNPSYYCQIYVRDTMGRCVRSNSGKSVRETIQGLASATPKEAA